MVSSFLKTYQGTTFMKPKEKNNCKENQLANLEVFSHRAEVNNLILSVPQLSLQWIRIQGIRFPIRIQGLNDQILNIITAEFFFLSKLAIYLFLASIKNVQATGEAFSLKREHPALQKIILLSVLYCSGQFFCPLEPDPDTDPGTPSNPDPRPQHCQLATSFLHTNSFSFSWWYRQCFKSGSGLDPDSIRSVDPEKNQYSCFEVLDVLF